MDKIGQEALLFDFYGQLLTEKQIGVMDMYINNDLSLGEIAEELGISRQGVHDTIKRSVKSLEEYETRLGLLKRYLDQKEIWVDIQSRIFELKDHSLELDEIRKHLDEINGLIETLI